MKLNVALNVALISFFCMTRATVEAGPEENLKKKLEGKYFSLYNFYNVEGKVRPGADFQKFTPVDDAPDIYDWVECFSTDGGTTFTKTKQSTTVLLDGKNYRVNVLEEKDDLFDGFTFVGSIVGKGRLSFGLFSFFNTGTFRANGVSTDIALGDDGCPL
jgi:hypothetical protein